MIDYYAEQSTDISFAEQILNEEWTHGLYNLIQYWQVDRTTYDPVFREQQNKQYTQIATFRGKIDLSPSVELMQAKGVTWEEGTILVEATRKHLEETIVFSNGQTYKTLLSCLQNDDVLKFPNVTDPDGGLKEYRILQITNRAWYGNTPLVIAFYAIVLPEFNS